MEGYENFTIVTEKEQFYLKAIEQKFAKDIFNELTDEITYYMYPSTPQKIEETEQFIDESIEKNRIWRQIQMVILSKENDEFLGCAWLHKMNTPTPELWVWVKKSAQWNWYGKKAMEVLKRRADKNLNYKYIIYPFDTDNIASRKVAEYLWWRYADEYYSQNMDWTYSYVLEYRIFPKSW